MLSVVVRNKNEAESLSFLLKNLSTRYRNDVDEIVVVDNSSSDRSEQVTAEYNARFETIGNFSYGGSANFAAEKASGDIIVIFSAHSYPVSPDFFQVIKAKFDANPNLAGLRCLHGTNDYRNYIQDISAKQDPNKSGLIFSGSAFKKSVWKKIPFNEKVPTFEDKDWTLRVLKAGYDIEFAPVVFNYEVRRSLKQQNFRRKNDLSGNLQVWHQEVTMLQAVKGFFSRILGAVKLCFLSIFYAFDYFFYTIKTILKKPRKFDY